MGWQAQARGGLQAVHHGQGGDVAGGHGSRDEDQDVQDFLSQLMDSPSPESVALSNQALNDISD